MEISNTQKRLLLLLLSLCLLFIQYAHTQEQNSDAAPSKEELKQLAIDKGAWLISKSDADLNVLGKTISYLISNSVIPQAIDRNIGGEVLLISQLSPPALNTQSWTLGVYESEKEMMEGIEAEAKDYYIPTGMDVQNDAAFVLYLKSSRTIVSGRLIKIESIASIQNTIQTYYELGFLPAAMSTFQNQLWILFSKLYDLDIKNISVLVKTADKDDTNTVLTDELSKKGTSLIDVSYTVDDKVIFLFQKQN